MWGEEVGGGVGRRMASLWCGALSAKSFVRLKRYACAEV